MNKLEKMKRLSESGTFQGGFATLANEQLLKLKGGSGSSGNNCQCHGSNNCQCNGNNCNCFKC